MQMYQFYVTHVCVVKILFVLLLISFIKSCCINDIRKKYQDFHTWKKTKVVRKIVAAAMQILHGAVLLLPDTMSLKKVLKHHCISQ